MSATITRRRKRKLKADINVVPYIDVMLVLLIIFMVTAPLLNLGVDSRIQLEGAQRAMRATASRELDGLEHNLEFLASVGSISPYVGLFGTVWGIMISFQGLANVKEATIATVAPGISEALIATAMGLFAAIPAVWAYNRFATKVERLSVRYDAFSEEFSSILQRQAHLDEV